MRDRDGFTLIELLIVIAVIAILATITVLAHNGVQDKARAVQVQDALKSTEDALLLYANDNNWSSWPLDNDIIGVAYPAGGGPSIDRLTRDLPGFIKCLPQVPVIKGIATTDFYYDNDGDTKPSSGLIYQGTDLTIGNIPTSVVTLVDKSMDDGNANTGKIRSAGTTLVYTLSDDQTIR